jgi:DNA-binding winged helix-turn-helix (wHTH) protein/tetratricopeptide (TPR) repeat protein
VLRFAGFEFDQQRAELRGPGGEIIRLRPKTYDLFRIFLDNPGRTLSKQELMEAVWPSVHVGEDSLFQCIKEIRAALGDEQRQMIRLVSGRGYLLDIQVEAAPTLDVAKEAAPVFAPGSGMTPPAADEAGLKRPWRRGRAALAAATAVGLAVAAGLALVVFQAEGLPQVPTMNVMPVVAASQDTEATALAVAVTDRLVDGLARIDNIKLVTPDTRKPAVLPGQATPNPGNADYVIYTELSGDPASWTLRARMVKTSNGQVEPVPAVTIEKADLSPDLLRTRLAAGVGHQLAVRINTLIEADNQRADPASAARRAAAKAAINQATASIMQTSQERFRVAQTMLEKALQDDPDNVDLQMALAALQLRGVQMAWYDALGTATAEKNAQTMLQRAQRARPNSIAVLEAHCRFLNATNQFIESLVTCSRAMAFDPWDGMALYLIGVGQLQLGRFEDALATFKQADRFDTPRVSRWTWLLGVGWTYVMMQKYLEALPWLERSIAITPASGRPLMLLAAAYDGAGNSDKAKAALAKAMEIRPGSTATNIMLPSKNSSHAFLAAGLKIRDQLIALGLPNP